MTRVAGGGGLREGAEDLDEDQVLQPCEDLIEGRIFHISKDDIFHV